jgi:hypothetical protein
MCNKKFVVMALFAVPQGGQPVPPLQTFSLASDVVKRAGNNNPALFELFTGSGRSIL